MCACALCSVDCCQWQVKGWSSVYMLFNIVTLMWTSSLIMQLKLYATANVISQWYFSVASGEPRPVHPTAILVLSSACGSSKTLCGRGGTLALARRCSFPSGPAQSLTSMSAVLPARPGLMRCLPAAGTPQRGSVRLALRHTLVSSFGSISFGALILTAIRVARRTLERASRENVICCIINCIAQPILAMLEQFSKFATVMTAITGDGFVDAAKNTFHLLKRNFLQTYSGEATRGSQRRSHSAACRPLPPPPCAPTLSPCNFYNLAERCRAGDGGRLQLCMPGAKALVVWSRCPGAIVGSQSCGIRCLVSPAPRA